MRNYTNFTKKNGHTAANQFGHRRRWWSSMLVLLLVQILSPPPQCVFAATAEDANRFKGTIESLAAFGDRSIGSAGSEETARYIEDSV